MPVAAAAGPAITGATTAEARVPDTPGVALQDVVYAGLDSLREMMPLDLCAYLHDAAGMGPQLYLRAPDLSTLDPARAFDLFSALRDALDTSEFGPRAVELAGFSARAIFTAGPVSRGLFVAGRRGDQLDDTERGVVAGVCAAVGVACHAVESTTRPPAERRPLRVAVEVLDGTARATVVVPSGDGVREGTGASPSPTTAVALATLHALGCELKLASVADDELAGERVVLVVLRDDNEQPAVGAALSTVDALHAVAAATMEAAARLLP